MNYDEVAADLIDKFELYPSWCATNRAELAIALKAAHAAGMEEAAKIAEDAEVGSDTEIFTGEFPDTIKAQCAAAIRMAKP